MNKSLFALVVILSALAAGCSDPRSWRANDQLAASGECKAVRKQDGATQWQCKNGETFWLESYRHTDKQGDWKQPRNCRPGTPKDSPYVYSASSNATFMQCPDGQSFWDR